jgi:hypothetical protein
VKLPPSNGCRWCTCWKCVYMTVNSTKTTEHRDTKYSDVRYCTQLLYVIKLDCLFWKILYNINV